MPSNNNTINNNRCSVLQDCNIEEERYKEQGDGVQEETPPCACKNEEEEGLKM